MADYIITGPDGKEYDVSADSPEALNHAVTQMFSAAPAGPPGGAPAAPPAAPQVSPAPAAPAKPPEPTFMDTVKGVLDTAGGYGAQGLIGARKGVSAMLGLPVDLASLVQSGGTWAINKATGADIPYPTDPVGGSKSIDRAFAAPARGAQAALGMPQEDTKPRSTGESIVRRVGEEVGATAVPVVGAVAKGLRVGVEGARELSPIQRMFVEPAAVNPTKFVGKEGTAAVAAGTGAGVVNQFTGKAQADAEDRPATTGQQLGDLGGAAAGYGLSSLGGTLGRAMGHLTDALRGKANTGAQVVRDAATDEIIKAAGVPPDPKTGVANTAPLADQIRDGKRPGDAIPNFQESTADRLQNPGVAALEYGRQSGPNTGMYAQRRNANTDATVAAVDRSAPDPTATPGTFRSALEGENSRAIDQASTAARQAEGEAAAAVQPLTPRTDRPERGNAIRGDQQAAADTARQATRDAYDNADINSVPLQPTFLAEALDRTTNGLSTAERTVTPQRLIDNIAQMPAGEPTTLREATSLRTMLLDQQRAAAADPGRRYEARVLGQYIEAVEDVIGQSVSPAQRAALDEARIARRAEADAFERRGDPVRGILQTQEGSGRYQMSDERVARTATDDNVIGRLLENADTPATRAAIREEILASGNAATASAADLYALQQQYARQIARFPGLDAEIGAAIRARVAENTAQGAERQALKERGRGGTGTAAKFLEYGDVNSDRAWRNVMSSKDPARAADELVTTAGDTPANLESARKAFWDILQADTRSTGGTTRSTSGNQPYLPGKLQKFLDDPAKMAVAERLYRDNPEHLDNLRKVSEALQGVDVRNSGKVANNSGTAQSILPTGETLASRVFAVQRGVVSPAFAAINIAGIIGRKAMRREYSAAVEKAIDQALLDPKFAELLLRENNPANRAALRASAKGWKLNQGATLVEMLQPDDPDAELKKAATR